LAYRGELLAREITSGGAWTAKKRLVEQMSPYRYAGALVVLAALGCLAWRQDVEESFVLGCAAFFFLTYASYYYFTLRVLLVILHASNLRLRSNRIGLVLLLLIEVATQIHQQLGVTRYVLTARLSVMLTVYFITVLALRLTEVFGRQSLKHSSLQLDASGSVTAEQVTTVRPRRDSLPRRV
jgi:hypothetical protein